jgi:hypothetical protein
VKLGQKAKVTVTVASPGLVPTGTIRMTYRGEELTAKALADGTVKLKLPTWSKPGKKKLVVSYVPDTGFQSASTTLKIKVTKK